MNFQIPELETKLDQILFDLPGKIIAIDGRDGVGKTSLGRYIACKYNISLIESDLYLDQSTNQNTYYVDELNRIINFRLNIVRPIIVEGIKVMELFKFLEHNWNFLIYISNDNFFGSRALNNLISEYEKNFQPLKSADYHLNLRF